MKYILILGLFSSVFIPQLSIAQTNPNAIVEDAVKFYFMDAPVMADIALCETGFRQFNADGSPLYDSSHTYIGVFQIAEGIHSAKAAGMGFNLATIDGNLGYAKYLYDKQGTNPWKGCLPKTVETSTPAPVSTPVTASPPATGVITSTLRIGMTSPEILTLQKLLNQKNFVLAASGPGSSGNETHYFGSLTRSAVQRFQCSKQIVCSGSESSSGYGLVGPKTRAALNSLK